MSVRERGRGQTAAPRARGCDDQRHDHDHDQDAPVRLTASSLERVLMNTLCTPATGHWQGTGKDTGKGKGKGKGKGMGMEEDGVGGGWGAVPCRVVWSAAAPSFQGRVHSAATRLVHEQSHQS